MSRFPVFAAVLFGKLTAIEALFISDLDKMPQAEIDALMRAAKREQGDEDIKTQIPLLARKGERSFAADNVEGSYGIDVAEMKGRGM